MQQRGLAGSGGSHQCNNLPGVDGQVGPAQHRKLTGGAAVDALDGA